MLDITERKQAEAKMAAALATGGTLGEVPRVAYDDTPPALWPAAERSCLATLLLLELANNFYLPLGAGGI